jgi:hypothetical protein
MDSFDGAGIFDVLDNFSFVLGRVLCFAAGLDDDRCSRLGLPRFTQLGLLIERLPRLWRVKA